MSQTPHHSTFPDDELLRRYRRTGDNAWLGYLLQRYTLLLLGVAMKYLKDQQAAQDAVQQIFLKSLTNLPQDEIENFKGWLYVIMRNHCLQILRAEKHYSADDQLQFLAADVDSAYEQQERELSIAEMQAALARLNTEQRRCVHAFYLEKKSYNEIMAETGYSFAQVKSYIQNGKRNLRMLLTRNKSANSQ